MKERLQKKLQQKNQLDLNKLYKTLESSNDIVEIRESIKGVINIHNTNKLALPKENTLLYFSKYISLLHPELSKLMPVDFENIENFLSIRFNNKSQEKKIMELFKLYEFLPLNSQSKKTTQAIEKLYKIIEADRPFDPSQILLRQESFKQAIEEKTSC